MKMLVHRIAGSDVAPFVLEELKTHFRFEHDAEDAAISTIGWTAAAELEEFAQIALLMQTVRVTIFDPVREYGLNLPVGPVTGDHTPAVTVDGSAFTDFDFVSGNRPYIRWLASYSELCPKRITVEYQAGFGTAASDIPRDLAQALMDQALVLWEGRGAANGKYSTSSPHMARIGARYRGVQV